MKKLLAFFLAAVMIIVPMSISVSATTVDTTESESNIQPRLNKSVTVQLGNAWTVIYQENNWLTADLTVTNSATSYYDVDIRIVSKDGTTILKDGKTIESGKSVTFSSIKSGGYIIEGKSADDVVHEYTLKLSD